MAGFLCPESGSAQPGGDVEVVAGLGHE